jgi:hypothetical protein
MANTQTALVATDDTPENRILPRADTLKQVPAPGPLGPDRFGATLDDSLPFRLSIAASRVVFTTGP